MRATTLVMRLLCVTAAAAACPDAVGATAPGPPSIGYWHLWTDHDGHTHLSRCAMRAFILKSMNKPADPQWQDRVATGATLVFSQHPSGFHGEWHEDPHVQFVVPLQGRWFVVAEDGTRAEMGPGEPLLGEDLNTRPDAAGHKGHLSGNVGAAPSTLAIVQLDQAPTVDRPCHVR